MTATAFARALQTLRQVIASLEPGQSLPVHTALAVQAGVSHVTMLKAMRRLADGGMLQSVRGRGTLLVSRGRPALCEPEPNRTDRWSAVSRAMRRDVVDGVWPQSGVSLKELAQRHGVCLRTLNKALGPLYDEGYAVRRNRLCCPTLRPGRQGGARLALIMGRTRGDELRAYTSRTGALLSSLEQESSRAGLSLELIGWRESERAGHADTARDRARDLALAGDVAGFVVWASGLDSIDWHGLLRLLTVDGRPAVVIDESGLPHVHRACGNADRVDHVLLGPGQVPGCVLAQHLLRLGHRRIAWITDRPDDAWSADRLAGIRRAFDEALVGDAVSVLHVDARRVSRRLAVESAVCSVPGISRPHAAAARQALTMCQPALMRAYERELAREPTADAFETARGLPGCTAWIGSDDQVALICLDYLRRRGAAVPGRVSVAGFDDSLDACYSGLTSYNFDIAGLARSVIARLLRSPHDRTPFEQAARGYVTARGSTGPVPRGRARVSP